MIISFAWTSGAVRDRSKTETRRFWKDEYAARFRPGTVHQAYDKSARYGGREIARIRILEVFRQPLTEMTLESYEREGGMRYWHSLREFQEMMLAQGKGDTPWVVRFEYV